MKTTLKCAAASVEVALLPYYSRTLFYFILCSTKYIKYKLSSNLYQVLSVDRWSFIRNTNKFCFKRDFDIKGLPIPSKKLLFKGWEAKKINNVLLEEFNFLFVFLFASLNHHSFNHWTELHHLFYDYTTTTSTKPEPAPPWQASKNRTDKTPINNDQSRNY